jgi:hypothetical protein
VELPSGIVLPPGVRSLESERNVSTAEVGKDGESWWLGVREGGPDVNPELTGSAKFPVYDEMQKTDSVVKSMLWAFMLPIRSVETEAEPADETPVDRLVADFLAWNLGLGEALGELSTSWSQTQRQGLDALVFGCAIEELIWGDLTEWRDADGDVHLVRPLRRLARRPAKTIETVERDRFGRLKKVTQNVPDAKPMPGEKVSFTLFEEEPGTWNGVSLLRSAWGPWKLKRELMVAAGIAFDRYSSGIPKVRYPAGNAGDKTKAEEMGREIRAHERGYVALEGAAEQGWDLEILGGAQTIADPMPLMRSYNLEILFAGMQAFMALGITESGSRAVGNVQQRPYYEAVDAVNHDLARLRTRQVVERIKTVNFGAQVETPVLRPAHIHTIDPEKLGAIADLAPYFNFTDREADDDVRDLLGLTKREVADALGIPRDQLESALRAAGLDQATLAQIADALPDEVGVAVSPNGKPPAEGDGLGLA